MCLFYEVYLDIRNKFKNLERKMASLREIFTWIQTIFYRDYAYSIFLNDKNLIYSSLTQTIDRNDPQNLE